jgi:hypothetical protein
LPDSPDVNQYGKAVRIDWIDDLDPSFNSPLLTPVLFDFILGVGNFFLLMQVKISNLPLYVYIQI